MVIFELDQVEGDIEVEALEEVTDEEEVVDDIEEIEVQDEVNIKKYYVNWLKTVFNNFVKNCLFKFLF